MENPMSGKSFASAFATLDPDREKLFSEHGQQMDGRWHLVERIVEDAMLQMAFGSDNDTEI